MRPENAGVALGRSIGPFVLGQTLQTAVDVIRHHLPKHKAEVCYHDGEPSRHLLLLNACEPDGASGFYTLRFDPTLQLLVTVSYFPPLRVRLATTTSAGVGGGPSLPSTIGDLIDIFRQPVHWKATTLAGRKEAILCFYEGTCFVFRCTHGGGNREFKLDEGIVASKSELIALHVTTHVGAPTYCLWGGHVSLSKLMPTHFGLLETRLVVEATTRWARGIEMSIKSGEIIQVLFGATSQDVMQALGCPDNVWYKEDRHVSVDGHLIQRAATAGVYFSYRHLGVSLLIDAKSQQVKKIVLHTNVPGYFEFCSYSRCYFKASLASGGLATNDEDSFLLMPETKWSTLVRNVDGACIRHLGRCLYEPSTNSYYPFQPTNLWGLFDQLLVETTSCNDIAKVTIVAPDSTTVATRQLVVTRSSGNLLPVREEILPCDNGLGHWTDGVPGVQQLGQIGCAATGHAPGRQSNVDSNEGHFHEGHSNEGHSNEGHSSEGHSNEGHSNEGHSNEGRSNEGHSNEGHSNEGHSKEGHSNEGCSKEGHSNEGHSNEGHSNEGHSNEGHSNEEHSNEGHSNEGHSNEGHSNEGRSNEGHSNEGHSNEGHSNEGHSNEGHSNEGHSKKGHSNERHSNEGHSNERLSNEEHTGLGAREGCISMSTDDDNELFCSAESSLEALRLSPASPAATSSTQEKLCISHFCPSLNTLLTQVQRAEAVMEEVLHYNCVVFDFLDGPRAGVANNSNPRDAPPSLTICLSNMDPIQWREGGSKEVDGNDDLKTGENEHMEDRANDNVPSAISPEDSIFEIVSHKELLVSAPSRGTASLVGSDNSTLKEGQSPMEGYAPGECHAPMECLTSDGHTFSEQLEAGSTESETPPSQHEDHPQILYRPPVSTATPSRLLSLSQDLGMVTWARERGGQAGTTLMTSVSTHAPPFSSHTSTQSEKVWKRLLGHTQSSERRVRQKYQPGVRKQEGEEPKGTGGQEVCEGAKFEDVAPENSPDSCMEEGRDEGVDQMSEDGHEGRNGNNTTVQTSEHQTATDDLGCPKTGSVALESQPATVLEVHRTGEQLDPNQGSGGSPDPFSSITLPSCDPQLSEELLLCMGPGRSPPLVARRCWDSSEPHRPDYGPPSLDLSTTVFENISCEHDEMCQMLTVRHQVLVDLKDKMRSDPSSIPQEVLGHTLPGEGDRSLLPTILEALNSNITNTWDIHLSISLLPLTVELISDQADLRHLVIGCNSILRVIDCHRHDLLSNSESPSDPVIQCLHLLKRVHLAVQALLPRLQGHGEADARTHDALCKLLLVREHLNRVLRKPQVE